MLTLLSKILKNNTSQNEQEISSSSTLIIK
jgi:hypothetical protein